VHLSKKKGESEWHHLVSFPQVLRPSRKISANKLFRHN
jgi:hypothetical protein